MFDPASMTCIITGVPLVPRFRLVGVSQNEKAMSATVRVFHGF